MNKYELAVRLEAKTSPAKKKAFIEKVEKMVALLKGKVGKLEEKTNDTGIFVFLPLELDGPGVKNLANKVKLEAEVEKYLLIRK